MDALELKALKVGDLVEWKNVITTDPNSLGIVLNSGKPKHDHTFHLFWEVEVKWVSPQEDWVPYTGTYSVRDKHSLKQISLIATAKKCHKKNRRSQMPQNEGNSLEGFPVNRHEH